MVRKNSTKAPYFSQILANNDDNENNDSDEDNDNENNDNDEERQWQENNED